jgi:hypothetical protein
MFRRKRILYVGSSSILLLSGLLFVAHTRMAPTVHAASCNTVARDSSGAPNFLANPFWGNNCAVSTTQNSDSNFVEAVQEIVNAQVDTHGHPVCGTLTVDGDFGPLTLAAVQCFQKLFHQSYHGGVVGTDTWNNMAAYIDNFPCVICDTGDGWTYFSSAGGTIPDFRVYSFGGTDEGAWYVRPFGTSTWCQMNTGDSCV